MCIRDRHMCVSALAEDLKARALKLSAQTKAPGNTPRAKARPTQDGRRGLQTGGAGRWVSSESVPTENPRRFHYLEQGDLQEKFPRFNNMCVTAVLLYQYRRCRPLPWEKRQICDNDHSTRTLIHTLIGMLWGDQCLDAVAREGSRLIRPIWLLCLERR